MAAFETLDWTTLDTLAIVEHRGVIAADQQVRNRCHQWLDLHQYTRVSLNFTSGISGAINQLNRLLNWQEQFGYEMKAESRNLDALRDGFAFNVPDQGGLVLVLQDFELAWQEDPNWSSTLLIFASEYSIQQLALGKRFFTLVEVESNKSPIIGRIYDSLSISYPIGFFT
jgi:hypothetical protein